MRGTYFDYYYGNEADSYSFYRIPKALFSDPAFSELSCEAKVLYGLMLDRMGLSLKNNWLDGEKRVFIYFTLEEVCEYLKCGHDKGVRLLAELDTIKGIGLIKRVKQGLGKPCRIYVKNCIIKAEARTSEKQKSGLPDNRSADCEKAETQTSEKPKSGVPKSRSADYGKTEGNVTDIIKTDSNETDLSIRQMAARTVAEEADTNVALQMDAIEIYRQIIADNISYPALQVRCVAERTQSILELLVETVCSGRKTVRIGGEDMPAGVVKSRFLKLDSSHVEYVFECMDTSASKIRNIRSYLLTALYRAPVTIEPYYQAEVTHDRGGKRTPDTPNTISY